MAACVLMEDTETSMTSLIAGSPVDSHMLTEFCGTPAPQVVPQSPPPHLWGSVYTKRPWRVAERVWEAFWDWSAPSAGGLGALRWGLFLARAPRGGGEGREPWFSNWKHIS